MKCNAHSFSHRTAGKKKQTGKSSRSNSRDEGPVSTDSGGMFALLTAKRVCVATSDSNMSCPMPVSLLLRNVVVKGKFNSTVVVLLYPLRQAQ